MSETARPPAAEEVGENLVDEAQARERVDLDPHEQPNAPNRDHEAEYVRHDQKDDSSVDQASDSDELDRPDNSVNP
jgi:hypothetical protein